MTHYPYLEITLSTRSLGLEKETDTSCQYLLATRHRAGRAPKGDPGDDEDDGMAEENGTGGEETEKKQAAEGEADMGEVVSRESLTEKGGTGGVKGKKRKSKALDEIEQISTKKMKPAV